MLNFVNIENEISYQDRDYIPSEDFGLQIALKNRPLDFQYESTESVSSFVANKINLLGETINTVSLSTSLISSDSSYHICDGQTDYITDLDCGLYYFLVNNKYQSGSFQVYSELSQGVLGNTPITISGLEFYDNNYEVPWKDRIGTPDLLYGLQYTGNANLLPFIYLSSESITSLDLIQVDWIGNDVETTSLSTSLISSDGTYHESTGLEYSFDCGYYYLRVNNKYESDIFAVAVLEEESSEWILATGIWNDSGIWIDTEVWID